MYKLKHKETNRLQFIELSNPDNTTQAVLCLDQGGRLSGLKINERQVLADFPTSTYEANYASALLFPFANRIKNGQYTFADDDFVLTCNEADKNNALHGLVYNKSFKCSDKEMTSNYGAATLTYQDDGRCKGFPFKFEIQLIYKLTDSGLSLNVQIVNRDTNEFPFAVGWHPYFLSEDLNESALSFKSRRKFVCDHQQIIIGSEPFTVEMPYQLKDVQMDDGFELDENPVEFLTPGYRMTLTSTTNENYLQLYTPTAPNTIAIEPMTGAADCFNNKKGLLTLSPKDRFEVEWTLEFKKFSF